MFQEDVPNSKSFARNILQDDIVQLETAIRLLSEGIVLNTKKDTLNAGWPKAEARTVEVDVFYDGVGDQFCVFRKVSEYKKKSRIFPYIFFQVKY